MWYVFSIPLATRPCSLDLRSVKVLVVHPSQWQWWSYTSHLLWALMCHKSYLLYQENELMHNSSVNAHPQSSQLAVPLWTDPWPKRVELLCASWSPLQKKKKKKCWHGMGHWTFPHNFHMWRESHHHSFITRWRNHRYIVQGMCHGPMYIHTCIFTNQVIQHVCNSNCNWNNEKDRRHHLLQVPTINIFDCPFKQRTYIGEGGGECFLLQLQLDIQ